MLTGIRSVKFMARRRRAYYLVFNNPFSLKLIITWIAQFTQAMYQILPILFLQTCGAGFRAHHQLTYHVRSHKNVGQEVICQHCSKAFLHAPHLAEHIKRIHNPDYVPKMPYECSQCKKRFASKKDRDCHIRQHHTGERPFVCHLCGKGYAVETTLTLHLKGVHQVDVQWKRATGWKKSKRDDFSGANDPEENLS